MTGCGLADVCREHRRQARLCSIDKARKPKRFISAKTDNTATILRVAGLRS